MVDSGSWIWEDFNNNTILNNTLINNDTIASNNVCEEVTNHWLYFIFSGYLLPLISPRVRAWLKETLNTLKNNEVTGKLVTLSEYGFEKIQDIENNDEMKEYIKRLCKEKKPELFYSEESLEKIALLFSGDDGKKAIAQSWRKLNKFINSGQLGVKVDRP